jgi:hypothetical protein
MKNEQGDYILKWNILDVWKSIFAIFKFSIIANSNLCDEIMEWDLFLWWI